MTKEYSMIKIGKGYKEYIRTQGITKTISRYIAGSDYVYNGDGTFTLDIGNGSYDKIDVVYDIQTSTEDYDVSVTTIDIYFDKFMMKTEAIEYFVKTGISMANLEVQFVNNTDLYFDDSPKNEHEMGFVEETGSFNNDTLIYNFSKKVADTLWSPIADVNTENSIKFKISVKLTAGDDAKIHSIDILPSGNINIGGSNA